VCWKSCLKQFSTVYQFLIVFNCFQLFVLFLTFFNFYVVRVVVNLASYDNGQKVSSVTILEERWIVGHGTQGPML
jgi:hypothetical protein